jgi:hypothetical protein
MEYKMRLKKLPVTITFLLILPFFAVANSENKVESICNSISKGELPLKETFYETKWSNPTEKAVLAIDKTGKYELNDPEHPYSGIKGLRIDVIFDSFPQIKDGATVPYLYLHFNLFGGAYLHIQCEQSKVSLCNTYCINLEQ